ncbi:MAG: bifunctional riboflavin kinase/FAD synthetase, partial [Boseongicola sp.]
MRIHRDTAYLDEIDRGSTVAIGNFDGVHLGHQVVLSIAAEACDAPLGVVTFEPHPREYFSPQTPPFRLMSADAKAHRLEKIGVSHLYELAFNSSLSELLPREFAQLILADRLGLAHVTVGRDFCFGKDRAGDSTALEQFGSEMGFGVTIADLVETNGIEVSSTR